MNDHQSIKRIRLVHLLLILAGLASVSAALAILFLAPIAFIGVMAWQQANSDFSRAAFDGLNVGASQAHVIESLGKPNDRSAKGMPAGGECWIYWEPGSLGPDPMYLVRFQDGVLTSTEIDDY